MDMKKETYLEWVKAYTRNDFEDGIPLMVDLVIEEMIEYDECEDREITSESLGDYSVSYDNSDSGYSKKMLAKLEPYVKPKKVTFH